MRPDRRILAPSQGCAYGGDVTCAVSLQPLHYHKGTIARKCVKLCSFRRCLRLLLLKAPGEHTKNTQKINKSFFSLWTRFRDLNEQSTSLYNAMKHSLNWRT